MKPQANRLEPEVGVWLRSLPAHRAQSHKVSQTANLLSLFATVFGPFTPQFCNMKNISNYRQILGVVTIAAGILAAACILMGAYAVDYNFDAFSEPALLLQYARHYKAAYWFLIFDLAGYYLLLLPAIFYLHRQYQYHSPWVPLFSFSGIAYVFTGAIGATILASAWPELMQQYLGAQTEEKQTITLLFNTVTHFVTTGLWNILEVLFAATWWIGFGTLLMRDHKTIGVLSVIAGAACLADSIGTMAGYKILAETGVNIYLVLGIIWPIVLGIHLMRRASDQPPAFSPTAIPEIHIHNR